MLRTIAVVALLSAGPAAVGQSRAPSFDPARPPRAGDEGVFYGPLVRVQDGASLIAKIQGVKMEIRLAEIDAPERDQPYGSEAKQVLVSLAPAGQQLVIMTLYEVEQQARNAKRGLWALSLKDRIEPWVWREEKSRGSGPEL